MFQAVQSCFCRIIARKMQWLPFMRQDFIATLAKKSSLENKEVFCHFVYKTCLFSQDNLLASNLLSRQRCCHSAVKQPGAPAGEFDGCPLR